jgi:deoxyribonuclease IV
LRIGIHTSKSGSFERAALKAHELGANTFQIFSTSPRIWRTGTPDSADVLNLQRARDTYDLRPLVVHDSYLINLGSCDAAVRSSSIAAFRSELQRCMTIGADYLVMHPGNCKDQTMEQGLINVIDGLAEAAQGLKSKSLRILLENTVGAGNQIGSRFEELAVIRQLASPNLDFDIGYCLDTCHCYASGHYDLSTAEGLDTTVIVAEKILGLENVPVFHTNDSKGGKGSRLDRHANIGEGCIGIEGFRRILNHPKLKSKAFILETPVDEPGDDQKNVDALKSLALAREVRPQRRAKTALRAPGGRFR